MDRFEHDEQMAAYHHRQLERLKEIFQAGQPLAVAAALDYCAQYKVQAPHWLTEQVSHLLNQLLHISDDRHRKRMFEVIRQYQRDQVHYARFDAVRAAKEGRERLQDDLRDLQDKKGGKARTIRNETKEVLKDFGSDGIFEEVEKQLKGTAAEGGEDTIRKSYQDLLRKEREGKHSYKYYMFDPHFLHRIGAHQNFFQKSQGRPLPPGDLVNS